MDRALKKAVIFDNDGVLVDSEPLYFQATKEMCARLGKELSLQEFIQSHIKSSRGTRHLLGLSEDEYLKEQKWRNARYTELLLAGHDLTCPGISQAVEDLAGSFRLCIVTSSRKTHFDVIHKNSTYRPYFEFVITLEDVSESKPAPEPYLAALKRLGLQAAECIVVEDSVRGLQSAMRAGVDCVIVKNQFSEFLDFTGATRIVNGPQELVAYLKTLV